VELTRVGICTILRAVRHAILSDCPFSDGAVTIVFATTSAGVYVLVTEGTNYKPFPLVLRTDVASNFAIRAKPVRLRAGKKVCAGAGADDLYAVVADVHVPGVGAFDGHGRAGAKECPIEIYFGFSVVAEPCAYLEGRKRNVLLFCCHDYCCPSSGRLVLQVVHPFKLSGILLQATQHIQYLDWGGRKRYQCEQCIERLVIINYVDDGLV
jgi:hypothetical protein